MIICLSGFVIAGSGPPACGARYSPHHQQLLHALQPPTMAMPTMHGNKAMANSVSSLNSVSHLTQLHRYHTGESSSGSCESVSPPSVSPPLVAPPYGPRRVRTLYACLGEGDNELSFEPNQIITDVVPSAEPGWLRGTLRGRHGLVPENYVEALP